MDKTAKIYIAGHRGMVGSSIARRLTSAGHTNLATRTHAELDLTNQTAVTQFLEREKLDYIFLAAAKVGGTHANNTHRAEAIYQNLMMEATVMSVVGFKGEIVFDASKPDGTPRKLLNVDRLLKLGWQAQTSLRDGIAKAYADFLTKAVA